jgi:ribosomal protein S1
MIMKKLMALILTLVLGASLSGCNRQIADFTYSYDKAIISLPNGEVIEGEVDSWLDFEDGDQIQVKINGVTYLVHSSNIALIS